VSSLRQRIANLLLTNPFVDRSGKAIRMQSRTLIVAPHPDDEVLGCGGTIARKVMAGGELRVVIVTDGGTSHAKFMDTRELVALRKSESRAAIQQLGANPDCCEFLEFPDGELSKHTDAAVERIKTILGSFDPEEIYVPHRADRQPDHESTFKIVQRALQHHGRTVTVYEYPIWLYHSWPWTWGASGDAGLMRRIVNVSASIWHIAFRCRTRSDVSEVLSRKQEAIAAYRSQMERRDGDPKWPIMEDVAGGEFIRYFSRRVEVFRRTVYRPAS
jgi:LmbE family N-acetylglucosaminyl deacetylase